MTHPTMFTILQPPASLLPVFFYNFLEFCTILYYVFFCKRVGYDEVYAYVCMYIICYAF
jgi:hypothetical protein